MRCLTVKLISTTLVAACLACPGFAQTELPASQQGAQYPQATSPTPPNDPYHQTAHPAGQVPQVANNAGHAIGNQPGNGQRQALATVGAPFHLTQVDQQFVDQILEMWEASSDKIKTFECQFERWEYDPVFGPGNDTPLIKSRGQLSYSKPDKGSFKINEIHRYIQKDESQPGKYVLQEHEIGEHWVCDGQAVYEYKHEDKQLVVRPLPEEMRGKSIVDGPLPFLFGAEAEALKARYWIRAKESDPAKIHLEAYPRRQEDAANYHHVEVILERKTMHPSAIQVHMPNGTSRSVYMFENQTVDGTLNRLFGALFKQPRTPLGWTRVVEPLPEMPQASQPQDSQHR